MRPLLVGSALLAALAVSVPLVVAGQDDPPQDQRRTLADLDPAERMKLQARAMQLAQPGPEHEALARYAGDFDVEIKMWPGPGMDAIDVQGTGSHEPVLGGRFLSMTGHSVYEFPGMGSFPVDSLQFLGYDRRSEHYTLYAMDTMGTYGVFAEGKMDPESKVLTMRGVDEDASVGITQVYDFVIEFVDDDTMKTSVIFHDTFAPGPFKMVEVVARRRTE